MGNKSAKESRKVPASSSSSSTTTTPTKKTNKENTPSSGSLSHPPPSSTTPSSHHSHSHVSAASSADSNHHSQSNVEPSNTQSSKAESDIKGFSLKKAEELFEKYRDKESEEDGQHQIGPEGIEQLCKDIGLDPEDVLVLIFAWHLNAQRMGFFSKDEFIGGLQKMGVDSVAKLKGQIPSLQRDLVDQGKFKDIYRFAFGFAKEREMKIIDLPTADALLALVLGNRFQHTEPLRQYLKEQTTYKSVNLDQWMNILEFSRSIKPDLSNYDENSAWPVLLDEYPNSSITNNNNTTKSLQNNERKHQSAKEQHFFRLG